MANKRRKKAFQSFSEKCKKEKEINLNPLLSIIINLVPLFLIVLNLRAIVGLEQNHMPPARYDAALKKESKELVNVNIELFKNSTKVVFLDYRGRALSKKTFSKISSSKENIIKYIESNKLYKDDNLGHLSIVPESSSLTFNEISHAMDISNYKKDEKKIFKNFSVEDIL